MSEVLGEETNLQAVLEGFGEGHVLGYCGVQIFEVLVLVVDFVRVGHFDVVADRERFVYQWHGQDVGGR